MTAWFVIGCGYTGEVLVRALVAAGADVTLTRRDRETAARLGRELGARGVAADLSDPRSLAALAIPAGATVACLAPPGPDPAGELAALIAAAPSARLIYVSSTGVYAPGGGAVVDETWPIAPTTSSGRARVAAEAALAAASSWISLRAAGIYGPGRGTAERLRAGSYRIVGDGRAHVSRIHVADLAAAIVAAGTTARAVTGFVNAADDDPAPIGEVADAIAARLGLPPPPRVAVEHVDPDVAGMLTADRRISNARLKRELGVVLQFPSWRDHLASLGL